MTSVAPRKHQWSVGSQCHTLGTPATSVGWAVFAGFEEVLMIGSV
jgi:hypothetical protein